jgi:hypothetical protein
VNRGLSVPRSNTETSSSARTRSRRLPEGRGTHRALRRGRRSLFSARDLSLLRSISTDVRNCPMMRSPKTLN